MLFKVNGDCLLYFILKKKKISLKSVMLYDIVN